MRDDVVANNLKVFVWWLVPRALSIRYLGVGRESQDTSTDYTLRTPDSTCDLPDAHTSRPLNAHSVEIGIASFQHIWLSTLDHGFHVPGEALVPKGDVPQRVLDRPVVDPQALRIRDYLDSLDYALHRLITLGK